VSDVTEILMHWHAGRSKNELAGSLGVDRKTLRKYIAPAEAAGIFPGGPAKSEEEWADLVRVPPEYSIERLTCAIASRLDAVIVGWPSAAQDRLPVDVPGTRRSCPGVPRRPGEGCRAVGAPAQERGAPASRQPDPVRPG
jgi:hypothetical protein